MCNLPRMREDALLGDQEVEGIHELYYYCHKGFLTVTDSKS